MSSGPISAVVPYFFSRLERKTEDRGQRTGEGRKDEDQGGGEKSKIRLSIENKGEIVYNYHYNEKIKILCNYYSTYAVR